MHKALSFVLILSLLLLDPVSAAPHKSLIKRTFRVNRYASNGSPNAASAMRKAFNKWGMTLPEGLSPSAQQSSLGHVDATSTPGQEGEVVNTPQPNDVEYLSPINIGGQEIVVNFDTGSSDLWVFSDKLQPESAKQGHTIFNSAKSSTFKLMSGATYQISFGDSSSSSGVVGTDTVNVGGATVTGQAVELATSVSDSFIADSASNGILGLGFGSINTVKPNAQKTFFENIVSDLKEPIFSAQLKKADKGFYEFGKIDSTAFSGTLQKVPVNSSAGFWQIESAYFQVGDGPVFHNPDASPAIADTGTTLLLVDDIVAEKYYAQVKGAQLNKNSGMWAFPCDATLPDFHLGLGPEYRAKIDGSLLNFQQVTIGSNTNACVGSLQPNGGSNLQIYGDILFKAQFAVFNIADKTIGFADHA